jgi:branched-subunit amino acid aminotransferase/4-amino-4-deoxychorismate lyase
MKGGFFLLNGQFFKEDDSVFKLTDLTRSAEGFREYFRAEHNEILFPESICSHLLATSASIGIDLTASIDAEGRLLRKDVSRLLNKNHLYLAAKISILVYPSDDRINILLRAEEIERGYYPVKEPGLLISFYLHPAMDLQPDNVWSPYRYFPRLASRRYANELNQPNLILQNKAGFACESIDGSFAFIKDDKVYFVPEGTGGYRCAIKDEVAKSVKETGLQPLEKEILSDDLLQADEVFLFDACNGIQAVLGLEDQRYFSAKSRMIADKLSAFARKDRKEKD